MSKVLQTQQKQMFQLRMMLLGGTPEPTLINTNSCGVDLATKSKAELHHIAID
jgi:hypothetical protein